MKEFSSLAAPDLSDLLRLADLLEAGLLTPPLTPLTLRDHLADAHAAPVAQYLGELAKVDMAPAHIALLLRAFAAGSQTASAAFGACRGRHQRARYVRRRARYRCRHAATFGKARTRVVAVGFAVHQGKSVFRTLADRLDNDDSFEATLCIDIHRQRGDTSLDREVVRRFANEFVRDEWPGNRLPLVYYDPRSLEPTGKTASSMHAKCVVIDGQEALVTSANFTEAAQERNIEVGLLVDSPAVAQRIEEHFMSLIRSKCLERLPLS